MPGPVVRVREGDTVDAVLHNPAGDRYTHSIDLHAATGPGGGGVVQVEPGETKAFRSRALNPGLYIYPCASPYVPTHLAKGQYGPIVVEPEAGLPLGDRESTLCRARSRATWTLRRPVMTTLVPAGGVSMVKFEVLNPGAYPLVDHNLERVFGKGALAVIPVTGPEWPDVFRPIALDEVGR